MGPVRRPDARGGRTEERGWRERDGCLRHRPSAAFLRARSLRKSLLALPPAVRWALGLASLAALLLLGYAGVGTPTRNETHYLLSARRLAPEDLNKISRALDRQRIAYHIDEDRRIGVSRGKREQAEEIVAKLELGPRLPGELRDQAPASSPWESPLEKDRREQQERAKILQIMINDLPGIVDSFVSINRPRTRLGLRPDARPSAFVRLETEGDRQLPFRTVQSITTILTGYEDGLSAESVTVVDRRGHKYLVAGNPELSALSSNRAREEELSQQILEQLDWIKGVRVSVQLPAATLDAAEPTGGRAPEPRDDPAPPSGRAAAAGDRGPASSAIALNRGLSLEADPHEPGAKAAAPDLDRAGAEASREPAASRRRVDPGRVWVRVPRSYYYQVSLLPGHKEPSREDLIKLATRTEEQIRTGVGLIVPLAGPAAWKTTIDMIQDEVPLADAQGGAAPLDQRSPAVNWGVIGVLAALAATLAAVGYRVLHARRPASRGDSAPHRLRYDSAAAHAPAPSERVREFVRRHPEAAVSVLERWTGQGGDPT
ncbi:MAG: hypothetical protein U0790_26410 [Isosphaeraceae bacterium]